MRVLISLLGMDQHEVGALTVAGILRDAGYEVLYLGRFQTPQSIIRAALEEDAQVIGISCYSWDFRLFLPQLMEGLKAEGLKVPVVVGGGILSEEDERWLRALGVRGVFRAGSTPEQILSFFASLDRSGQRRGRPTR